MREILFRDNKKYAKKTSYEPHNFSKLKYSFKITNTINQGGTKNNFLGGGGLK